MKTKKIFLSISFVVYAFCLNAQITFQKTFNICNNLQYCGYGGDYTVQQTMDKGYIIAGTSISKQNSVQKMFIYLIKTDEKGDTLWVKSFGSVKEGNAISWGGTSVQQTNDNGYIVTGFTKSFGAGGSDVYLIKTDMNGDTLWTRAFGGNKDDEGHSVQQTADGGYIITGNTNSFGTGGGDVYLIKTNASGNLQWTKTFGDTLDNRGFCVRQTLDKGYVIVGSTSGYYGSVYLIKTNVQGDTLWTKTYGGNPNKKGGYSVQQTHDSGYIITGTTTSFGAVYSDAYVIKTDSNGDTLWTRAYGTTGTDEGDCIQQTSDDGYIFYGNTRVDSMQNSDFKSYLVKIKSNGDTLWTKYFDSQNGYGSSVWKTQDGGYILAGVTTSPMMSIHLIKTDAYGTSGCNEHSLNTIVTTPPTIVSHIATQVSSGGVMNNTTTIVSRGATVNTLCTNVGINETLNTQEKIHIYPNPAKNEISIETQLISSKTFYEIYNIMGLKVAEGKITAAKMPINISSLAMGMYFIRVNNAEGTMNMKFVKQ